MVVLCPSAGTWSRTWTGGPPGSTTPASSPPPPPPDTPTTAAVDSTLNAWLRFKGEEVAFNNSCNGGGGPAQIGDDTITFGALRQTLMACVGASDTLEQFMAQVLQGETTYTISTGHGMKYLQIMSTDGTKGLGLLADDTVGLGAVPSGSATVTSTSG